MSVDHLKILTIQSHVAYGYVGNKISTFAIQRLGNQAIAINTLQFSNHTGYDKWSGQVFSSDHINEVICGLRENGLLYQCDAVITGYIGDESIGRIVLDAILEIKKNNKSAIYCCDPVMGDVAGGFYVSSGVQSYMSKAILSADIITPNQFEASALANHKINNLEDVKFVARKLYSFGPKIVVITSVLCSDIKENHISNVAFDGINFYMCRTPYISSMSHISGTGDLFTSLFLSHYLSGIDLEVVLQKTASSLYAVVKETNRSANNTELDVISNQNYLVNPGQLFSIERM